MSKMLNPLATEFKLNPCASEFTPSFAFVPTFSAIPEPSNVVNITSSGPCENGVTSVHVQNTIPEASCKTEKTDIALPHVNNKTTDVHSEYLCPSSNPQVSTKTLRRIVSGECLEEMDLSLDEMLLESPRGEEDLSREDFSPRKEWCGEEPPQLIWSRSAEDIIEASSQRQEGQDSEAVRRSRTVKSEKVSTTEESDGALNNAEEDEEAGGEQGSVRSTVAVDDFEILCMIGQGGFGKVFQVRKKDTKQILAMKCMRKDCVVKDNLEGTRNERQIMSSVRHPYIVNMHYAFQCKRRLFLIMDYFPGGQFLDMLHHHAPFDQPAYTLYTGEIVLALGELHSRGIVHRDLKPENLLVDAEGHLVMTDFGCSKVGSDNGSVRTASWAGTELYMAPEQLQKSEYGAEVDWWALGALVWEMCTGDNPFFHENRKVMHNNILKKKLLLPSWLPPSAHSFLKALLHRDPTKRLGHAGGAQEVQTHAFFKGFSFPCLLARELAAPLRSRAKEGDVLDVSAHAERYTKTKPLLSPIPSPAVLPSCKQALFSDFDWSPAGAGGALPLTPAAVSPAPSGPRVLSKAAALPVSPPAPADVTRPVACLLAEAAPSAEAAEATQHVVGLTEVDAAVSNAVAGDAGVVADGADTTAVVVKPDVDGSSCGSNKKELPSESSPASLRCECGGDERNPAEGPAGEDSPSAAAQIGEPSAVPPTPAAVSDAVRGETAAGRVGPGTESSTSSVSDSSDEAAPAAGEEERVSRGAWHSVREPRAGNGAGAAAGMVMHGTAGTLMAAIGMVVPAAGPGR